jgi:hypothetical protein
MVISGWSPNKFSYLTSIESVIKNIAAYSFKQGVSRFFVLRITGQIPRGGSKFKIFIKGRISLLPNAENMVYSSHYLKGEWIYAR